MDSRHAAGGHRQGWFSGRRKAVMADKKNDAKAESEYLRQRISELRMAGANITPETAEQLSRDVGNALRAAGREALALRYATAFQRFNRTRAELARENDEGQINEAAQQAMNDALEDFERVEAEVLAVFDQLEKGPK